MQKRGRSEKRRLKFDGVELPGLNRCTGLAPEEGQLTPAELKRKYTIGDGTINWPPIEGAFLDQAGNGIEEFFREWKLQFLTKEIEYMRVDGHGDVFLRAILPDAECLKYKQTDYDANGVTVAMIEFTISYYEPVFI